MNPGRYAPRPSPLCKGRGTIDVSAGAEAGSWKSPTFIFGSHWHHEPFRVSTRLKGADNTAQANGLGKNGPSPRALKGRDKGPVSETDSSRNLINSPYVDSYRSGGFGMLPGLTVRTAQQFIGGGVPGDL